MAVSYWKTVLFQISGNIQNIKGIKYLEVRYYAKPIPYTQSKKNKKLTKEQYIDPALKGNFSKDTFCGRAWVPLFNSIQDDNAFTVQTDKQFAALIKKPGAKTGYLSLSDFLLTLKVLPEDYFKLLSQAKGDHLRVMRCIGTGRFPDGHNCFFAQIKVRGKKGAMKRFTTIRMCRGAHGLNWETYMDKNIDERLNSLVGTGSSGILSNDTLTLEEDLSSLIGGM